MGKVIRVRAEPFDFNFEAERTAFLIIDMQHDFCSRGGFLDSIGRDIALTRRPIAPIRSVLAAVRKMGMLVVYTKLGFRPDLSDCSPYELERTKRAGAQIGKRGPLGRYQVRGEKCNQIIPELKPRAGEVIVDKPGKSAFNATDLHLVLTVRGITHLIFSGVTTSVCVHTTLRHANDLGYYNLLLEDCCAEVSPQYHKVFTDQLRIGGGVFGLVSDSRQFLAAVKGRG